MILVMVFIPGRFFFLKRDYTNVAYMVIGKVRKIFDEVGESNKRVLSFLCICIFVYLIMRNLLGLFPFLFTSTAHIIVTIGFGLII